MNYKKYELRELIEIKNGKDLKNKNNGTIPVYGTGGIIGNIDQYLYDGESILLPRKGSLDNIEYVNGKFWTIDTMYWTKINKNIVYGKFLFLYLSLLNTSKRNTGSTLPSMTFETYYSLKIFLPEYKEQKKIADFIFKIIEKINKNNQINNNLEELMKIIYQRWFLEYEFPNEEGKSYKSNYGQFKFEPKLKKEIPENWELVSFGQIITFTKGRIPNELYDEELDDTIPYITIDVANNGKTQFCNKRKMIICNGETIMVMDGASSGDVYCGNYGALGSTFSMLSSKRGDIHNSLIYMLLNENKLLYKKANTGSTVPHANKTFIENMRIALPKDCTFFSNEFDSICQKIEELKKENKILELCKKYLLPLLINGQINVDDIEI